MSQARALVEQLEALTTDQPMTPAGEGQTPRPALPLKHHQVEAYTEELRRLGDVEAGGARDLDGNRWVGGDRQLATKRIREIRKILKTQAAKPITGPRANEVYKVIKEIRDEVFKPNLLPSALEHKANAGTVGHLQRTILTPLWNRTAVAFKRAIRAIDPDNPDPDLANIERFRPQHTGPTGASTFDVTAVIPGNFAFGTQAKDNWPFDAPTADTALAQVQRREAAEAVTAHSNGHAEKRGVREKKPASAAQLAAIKRMHAASAAKRAAAKAEAQGD